MSKRFQFRNILDLKHIPSVAYSIFFSYIRAIRVNNTPFLEYFICKKYSSSGIFHIFAFIRAISDINTQVLEYFIC